MAVLIAAATCIQAKSIITTVAGKGRVLAGLGGPATGVAFANPRGIAVDAKGNVYTADNVQNAVFPVSPGGIATVFAGTGSLSLSGDTVQARCSVVAQRLSGFLQLLPVCQEVGFKIGFN